jgi:hypothetical protein
MKRTFGLSRLLGAAACVLLASACSDDGGSISGADCTEIKQTAADAEAGRLDGLTRVRLNIVSRLGVEEGSTESIALDGVELYQGGKCVRLAATATPALGTLESDMGGLLAEGAVELGQITHVTLLPASGTQSSLRLRGEKIALAQPVQLQEGMRTEVFMALEPVAGSTDVTARFVAAGAVPPRAGAVMVAEPGRGGTMTTQGGFSLELGPESMSVPTVYSVMEHDVGGVSPLLEISPQGKLGASGRLSFRVDAGRLPQGIAMGDYDAHVGGVKGASTLTGNTVSMDVSSLGLTQMRTAKGTVRLPGGVHMAIPAGASASAAPSGNMGLVNNECSASLSRNQSYYYSLMHQHKAIGILDCEDKPPYVHIALVNLRVYTSTVGYQYPRITFPSQWYSGTNDFLLHTIKELGDQHAGGGVIAAINGYKWQGDYGVYDGGIGTPEGTVYINGAKRSISIPDAEAIIGFTSSGTAGGTMAQAFNKPAGGSVSLGSYNWNAVSSTTSIIRNGTCARTATEPAEWDHWSALGIGNNILVMVSSTTGNTTTAYELCSVFEGLSILGGAIRLDGSGSAAMYWGGTHLNPLAGEAWWKYGDARHIPYAIAAKH